MTTLDLTRLKEAALAATPGPWKRTAGYGVSIQIANDKQHQDFATYNGDAKLLLVAESKHGRLPGRDADFIAEANPAAVLELIARLEAAEADAERYRYLAAAFGQTQLPAFLERNSDTCGYCPDGKPSIDVFIDDMRTRAMPNDPLDDVLPLPGEKQITVTGESPASDAQMLAEMVALGQQRGYGTEWAQRTKAQRDSLLNDIEGTEGSSHG